MVDPTRDEAHLLAEVTGLRYRLGRIGDAPLATLHAASPACEEGCEFFVDMPSGWLRVTTSLPLVDTPSQALLLQLDGGFGYAALDRGRVRLSISLPGLKPFGSPVIGAIQRLHELRAAVAAPRPGSSAPRPRRDDRGRAMAAGMTSTSAGRRRARATRRLSRRC